MGAILLGIGLIWLLLTLWAQQPRSATCVNFPGAEGAKEVLILFNPDPFYDLDRQIGTVIGQKIASEGWGAQLCSFNQFEGRRLRDYGGLVLIANTYNWAPDKPTRRFIAEHPGLKGFPVIPITLGSGSTKRSVRVLEEALKKAGADLLLEGTTYWLMKPNTEEETPLSNVEVALSQARERTVDALRALEKQP